MIIKKINFIVFLCLDFIVINSAFSQNWEQMYKDLTLDYKKLEGDYRRLEKRNEDLAEANKINAKTLSGYRNDESKCQEELANCKANISIAPICNCMELQNNVANYQTLLAKRNKTLDSLFFKQKYVLDSVELVIAESDLVLEKRDSLISYLKEQGKQQQEMYFLKEKNYESEIQNKLKDIAQKDVSIKQLRGDVAEKLDIIRLRDSAIAFEQNRFFVERTNYTKFKDSANVSFEFHKQNHIWSDTLLLCGKKIKLGDVLFFFPTDSTQLKYSTKHFEKYTKEFIYLSYLLNMYQDKQKDGYKHRYKIRVIGKDNTGNEKEAQGQANMMINFLTTYPLFQGQFKGIEIESFIKEDAKPPLEKGVEIRIIK